MSMDFLLSIFAAIAMAMAEVIGKLVISVLDITIPVMQYQGFTSSPVVNTGWAIVRDVVNMFFVVILIIIAMQTIFGVAKTEWRQQVPKIMVMAIVINFSKTLCGIMIDFAQVIMLTFANALKDIAGGNFIQMLGLGDIFSLSAEAEQVAGAAAGTNTTGTSAFDLFAAGAAAVVMMVWVLAVVMILLCVLVYRVVMLWVLIVMAPLAWFTKIVPFEQAKGAYSDWWKNFICYCSVGPVLTFFLWLTLAVAGSGFIASQDTGFSAVAPKEAGITAGFVTTIFEWQSLLSFVIGMAMLMAGLDAASKVCAGAKGGVGKLLAQTKGGGFINQAAGSLARRGGAKAGSLAWKGTKAAGSKLGGAALAAGGAVGGFAVSEAMGAMGVKGKGAEQLRNASRMVGGMNIPIIGNMAATKLGDMAGKIQKSEEEDIKAAGKDMLAMDDDTQLDFLANVARGGKPMLDSEKKKAMAVYGAALKDKDKRTQLEATGDFQKLHDMFKDDIGKLPKNSDLAKAQRDLKKTRPDMFGQDAIDEITEDNVGDVDNVALASEKVQERLKNVQSKIRNADNSGFLSEYDAILKRGGKRARAMTEGKGGMMAGLREDQVARIPDEELAKNVNETLLSKRPEVAGRIYGADNKVWEGLAPEKKEMIVASLGDTNARNSNPMRYFADARAKHKTLESGAGALEASTISRDNIQRMIASYKRAAPEQQEEMEEMLREISFGLGKTAVRFPGSPAAAEATARQRDIDTGLSDAQKSTLKPLEREFVKLNGTAAELNTKLEQARDSLEVAEAQVEEKGTLRGYKDLEEAANYVPAVRQALDRIQAAKDEVDRLKPLADAAKAKADAALARLNAREH